jgi:hypothetical protein
MSEEPEIRVRVKVRTYPVIIMVSEVPRNYYTPILSSYYSNSSHQVNLDKEYLNDTKEKVWTRSYHKFELHNSHTFKRWKISNHSDYSISYRTRRVRSLLAYYIKYVSYNMSWVRQQHNKKTEFDTFQGVDGMSISCRYCGNPIVFDDRERSSNGKKIPLEEWNHKHHDCKLNPYNRRGVSATEKRAINKIGEYQIIEDIRNQITNINNRLSNYEPELIARGKPSMDGTEEK